MHAKKRCKTLISGTFTLSHGGKTTHPIPYDATAALLNAELTKLSTVDQLSVTRTVTSDMQRGYEWTVTFLADTMQGDVSMLRHWRDFLFEYAFPRLFLQT